MTSLSDASISTLDNSNIGGDNEVVSPPPPLPIVGGQEVVRSTPDLLVTNDCHTSLARQDVQALPMHVHCHACTYSPGNGPDSNRSLGLVFHVGLLWIGLGMWSYFV
jgi:hypothetical protein